MSESDFERVEGTGNVFRDLGDPEADLKHAKAVLAARVIAALDGRGLSVRKAAALPVFGCTTECPGSQWWRRWRFTGMRGEPING